MSTLNARTTEQVRKITGATALLLAFVLFLAIAAAPWRAYAETYGDLTYELSEGEVTITGYVGTPDEVEIPGEIDSCSVTAIGDGAFCNCESLVSIVIPDTVLSIGEESFGFCTSLEAISFGNSVTSIGKIAFQHCDSLETITFPDSLISTGFCSFFHCSSLKAVTIPEHLTLIGGSSFRTCESIESFTVSPKNPAYKNSADGRALLTKDGTVLLEYANASGKSYTIPSSVTTLKDFAFCRCQSLESVVIGKNVTNIRTNVFTGCTSLKTVTIPDSVTSMGSGVFNGCESLKTVYLGKSMTELPTNVFLNMANPSTVYVSTQEQLDLIKANPDWYISPDRTTVVLVQKLSANKVTLAADSCTYTGGAKTPTVIVKNAAGTKLVKGTDYTVAYKNNTAIGKATVTITGKGAYTGTVTKTFRILPAKTAIKSLINGSKSFKVVWTPKTKAEAATGYQIRYSTKSSMASSKTATITSYKTKTKTVKNLKAKKKYYVQIRTYKKAPNGVKYYSAWSAKKPVTTK